MEKLDKEIKKKKFPLLITIFLVILCIFGTVFVNIALKQGVLESIVSSHRKYEPIALKKSVDNKETEIYKELSAQVGHEDKINLPAKAIKQNKEIDQLISKKQLNEYREFLENYTLILQNFFLNKNFDISIFEIYSNNIEIKHIVKNLKIYNELFQDKQSTSNIIATNHIIEKFIQIRKKSELNTELENLKAQIVHDIPKLTNYIYSEEFAKKFLQNKLDKYK